MSGALPKTDFTAINIKSNQRTLVSETDSGKTFRRQVQGQRWSFTIKYPSMTRADFAPTMAFMIKQRSQKENFTIIPPELEDARGVETGTLAVNGSHTAGDTTIAIDGFAGDTANRLRQGDFIKFNGHTKIYMVVADVTSSSGAATVTIEPPLISTLANDEAVTYDNIPFTVHLINDIQEFGVVGASNGGELLYEFQLDVEEAL